jgi:2-oxo-4-hydroxy-4-carboxy--5-ureidoimidazoline (OHCU) decarboxylase
MLAVSLVDFHDAMELMLDAAHAKDVAKISALYPQVSDKLKAVEAEANDAEIVAIRSGLDELLALAKNDKQELLAAQAERLKSSFIKFYLQRG